MRVDNKKENKRTFGSEGEDLAAKYLTEKGFEIIERNYFSGHGEIDIIANDPRDNYLVFVEVKARNTLILSLMIRGTTTLCLLKLKPVIH